MITFSPIQKLIQETLHQKMKMLEKTPKIGINEPSTGEGGVPQENYMFARSVFLRMTSLLTRNEKPIVLMGGELSEGQYRKGLDVYGQKSGGVNEENPNLRPMAGVKDVNVEYVGGGMKIGATRKTSINWTCWTWEELQKFKPFFLKHGRTVLIEFGWGFQGSDAPMMLDIIKENGELNHDLINGTKEFGSLQEMIPEFILKQKGHYDAVLGTINNFEFSVNETGGFDCTTDLVSMGVNTMRKMDSKESVEGHVANLPILNPVETGYLWWKDKDFLKNQARDKNPYYSFRSYMGTLEGHLHLNAENSKGSVAYILGSHEPYCTWGWFEDNVLSRFAGQINSDKQKVVGEFRSIENTYKDDGSVDKILPVQIRASRDLFPIDFSPKGWFWVSPESVKEDDEFWNDKTLKELNGGGTLIQDTNVYQVGGSPKLGKFQLMFAPPYQQNPNTPNDNGYVGYGADGIVKARDEAERWRNSFKPGSKEGQWNYKDSHFRPFKNSKSNFGILRNIYFGHEFLTECFEKSTIAEGIESVWNKFSQAYGGIYDFGIEFDDKEGRLMIKDKGFANKKVSKILENTSKNPNSDVYDNKGVFVFPVWEKTSIVKNQNLSAKLPNRMQVAAMYGNNDPAFGDGQLDDLKDWGAVSLGRNEREVEDDENKQYKLYESLIGNMELPFKKSDGKEFTFGNASADDSKSLQWRSGTSNQTTNVYEDMTAGGSRNEKNDGFGKGINEFLEKQLEVEFKKRLVEASGYKDEAEYNENVAGSAEKQNKAIAEDMRQFKKASTDASSMKNIYQMGTKGIYFKETIGPIRYQGHAEYSIIPKLKPEYHGIMKMALKGGKEGILKTSDPLIPIELELEIDGTGGIFPGNSFHSSYLPRTYMDRMCFQIKGASHKIDSSGWTTTLVGQMRVAGLEKEVPIPTQIEKLFDENVEVEPGESIVSTKYTGPEIETVTIGTPGPIDNTPTTFGNEPKSKPIGYLELTYEAVPVDESAVVTNNQFMTLFPEDDIVPEGKIQIGKLNEFDVSQGTPIKLKPDGTLKDLDGNLYKIGPDGQSGVRYDDQTTNFSPDVGNQFDFGKPLEWNY